jgi:hypothetical protein
MTRFSAGPPCHLPACPLLPPCPGGLPEAPRAPGRLILWLSSGQSCNPSPLPAAAHHHHHHHHHPTPLASERSGTSARLATNSKQTTEMASSSSDVDLTSATQVPNPFVGLRHYVTGRGLHSFPFPLTLNLLCPFPLNVSLLCPSYNPNQPVDVARRCSS